MLRFTLAVTVALAGAGPLLGTVIIVKSSSNVKALMNTTSHVCLVSAGQRAGLHFLVQGGTATAYGDCLGSSSWMWIENIATAPGVRVTPPGTPRFSDLVDTFQGPQAIRRARAEMSPEQAEQAFQRAAATATPVTLFDFVLPPRRCGRPERCSPAARRSRCRARPDRFTLPRCPRSGAFL